MPTTSSISVEEQFVLRVERELNIQLDFILEKIQTLSKDYSIETDKEKSPFKNVLAAATEMPTSLEVIKNFIRYQGGRKPSKIWEKPGFANALVQKLDSLSTDVDAILSRISDELNEKISSRISDERNKEQITKEESQDKLEELLIQYINTKNNSIRRSLHLQLTQLYLGYLSREHTARLGEKPKDIAPANQTVLNSAKDSQSHNKPIKK